MFKIFNYRKLFDERQIVIDEEYVATKYEKNIPKKLFDYQIIDFI